MASKNSSWGVSKIAFYALAAVAILYLLNTVLNLCGVSSMLVSILFGVGEAILTCVAAYIAWNFVDGKSTVWKVLYLVFVIVILIGIILPKVL